MNARLNVRGKSACVCAQSLRVQAHMMSARTAQLASTCARIPAAGNHGSALAIMSVASGSGGASFSCYSYPMCQFKCPTVALALSLNHLQLLTQAFAFSAVLVVAPTLVNLFLLSTHTYRLWNYPKTSPSHSAGRGTNH